MASGIDLLHLFPELAAIRQQRLQVYCNEWVRRPIAQDYGIAQIIVDGELLLHIGLDATSLLMHDDRAFIPIDELLGYIIDRHFEDAEKRRELHASVRDVRQHWAELNRDYEAAAGRMGTLYLTCKNPQCRAELETAHQAREGQRINCKPISMTCPFCGSTYEYEGGDLQLKVTD